MDNFTFYSPTLFAFGKERENETGGLQEHLSTDGVMADSARTDAVR